MNDKLFAIYNIQNQEIVFNDDLEYYEIFKSIEKCRQFILEEKLGSEFEPIEVKLTY